MLGELPVARRPTNLDYSSTVLAVGAGGGCSGIFSLSFVFSFSLSLGGGPILNEILSQRAMKPKTTNQPIK